MNTGGIKKVLLLVLTMLMATGIDAIAQRGRGMDRMGGMEQVCPNIPNLTEEQSSHIMDLRTDHLSEMQSYRDQIDVNRARYRELMRGDRSDIDAINENIDSRAEIRSEMAQKQAAHHQSIRDLLTEEQRTWFDAAPRAAAGPGAGMRQAAPFGGRGAGMRAAPGRGRMWQEAPYRGRGGRGAYCPWGARGYRRGF